MDVAKVYRGTEPEKELMKFACSMSRSIDPRRPRFLTKAQSRSVNDFPSVKKRQDHVNSLSKILSASETDRRRMAEKRDKSIKRLRNEKQRQRRLHLTKIQEEYDQEQPVRDSAQQLSGKAIDGDVRDALKHSGNMMPEHLCLVDAIMTLPETSWEKEIERRIRAINAVTAYCGVEEDRTYGTRSSERAASSEPDETRPEAALDQALRAVQTEKRPLICFLCVGNLALSTKERKKKYATPGSLSRHFRRHVTKLGEGKQADCQVCNVKGMSRMRLQNHAERFHGTVTRVGA